MIEYIITFVFFKRSITSYQISSHDPRLKYDTWKYRKRDKDESERSPSIEIQIQTYSWQSWIFEKCSRALRCDTGSSLSYLSLPVFKTWKRRWRRQITEYCERYYWYQLRTWYRFWRSWHLSPEILIVSVLSINELTSKIVRDCDSNFKCLEKSLQKCKNYRWQMIKLKIVYSNADIRRVRFIKILGHLSLWTIFWNIFNDDYVSPSTTTWSIWYLTDSFSVVASRLISTSWWWMF